MKQRFVPSGATTFLFWEDGRESLAYGRRTVCDTAREGVEQPARSPKVGSILGCHVIKSCLADLVDGLLTVHCCPVIHHLVSKPVPSWQTVVLGTRDHTGVLLLQSPDPPNPDIAHPDQARLKQISYPGYSYSKVRTSLATALQSATRTPAPVST
jgi:hypothetical protein